MLPDPFSAFVIFHVFQPFQVTFLLSPADNLLITFIYVFLVFARYTHEKLKLLLIHSRTLSRTLFFFSGEQLFGLLWVGQCCQMGAFNVFHSFFENSGIDIF